VIGRNPGGRCAQCHQTKPAHDDPDVDTCAEFVTLPATDELAQVRADLEAWAAFGLELDALLNDTLGADRERDGVPLIDEIRRVLERAYASGVADAMPDARINLGRN
jgi:hypothetical protein